MQDEEWSKLRSDTALEYGLSEKERPKQKYKCSRDGCRNYVDKKRRSQPTYCSISCQRTATLADQKRNKDLCVRPGCNNTVVQPAGKGRKRKYCTEQCRQAGSKGLPVERTPLTSRQGFIYFARFSDRIKIGYSTRPEGRLMDVPHDEVLLIIKGTRADEARYHRRFRHLHCMREWFFEDPDLMAFIAELKETSIE